MSVPDVSGKCIANLGYEEIRHEGPVFHGDTIYAETRVLEKSESAANAQARATVPRALSLSGVGARQVVSRVSPLASETGKRDLAAVVPRRPGGLCLPKVESPAEVGAADAAVLEIELACGLAEGEL